MVATSTELSETSWRSSAEFTMKRHRSTTASCSAVPRQRSTRFAETSLKITRPLGPTRSSAPKPIRPSPQPTSRTTSPALSAARSSTLSRRRCRSFTRLGGRSAPPWRRWRIQSAQQSSADGAVESTAGTGPSRLLRRRRRGRASPAACCPCPRGGFGARARARCRRQDTGQLP